MDIAAVVSDLQCVVVKTDFFHDPLEQGGGQVADFKISIGSLRRKNDSRGLIIEYVVAIGNEAEKRIGGKTIIRVLVMFTKEVDEQKILSSLNEIHKHVVPIVNYSINQFFSTFGLPFNDLVRPLLEIKFNASSLKRQGTGE